MLTSCAPGGSETGRAGWLLTFHFDAELIEALKTAIPYFDSYGVTREWRKDATEWWVSRDYEHVLGRLFTNFTVFRDAPRLL